MKEAGLTIQERKLAGLMKLWVVLFGVAGIAFAVIPQRTINLLNRFGEIAGWTAPPIEALGNSFWLALALSLMATLTVIAYLIQRDVLHYIKYTRLIILAKFVSAASFLLSYFASAREFAYLAAFVTDGFIGLITWFYYRRAVLSRYVI